VAGSTVGSTAILRTIRDTLVIFARLHLSAQYRVRPIAQHAAPIVTRPQVVELLAEAA
jgi:hypothetical protein